MVNETWRCGGECRGSWKRVEQQPVVALAKKVDCSKILISRLS